MIFPLEASKIWRLFFLPLQIIRMGMKEVEDGDSQQLLWLVLVLTSILGSREQFDLWKLGALTLLSCSLGRRLNETLVYDHLMSLF